MIAWEHANGVRGVWDITLAPDLYLRSDYYTNDERWEITGSKGFARVNRCTGRGIQQPSLEVYADGEMRGHHALDDDWASSFRDSGRHWLRWLRTGEGPAALEWRRGRRRAAFRALRLREQPLRRPRDPARRRRLSEVCQRNSAFWVNRPASPPVKHANAGVAQTGVILR